MFTPLFAFLLFGLNRESSLKSYTGVYDFQNEGAANFGVDYSISTISLFTFKYFSKIIFMYILLCLSFLKIFYCLRAMF